MRNFVLILLLFAGSTAAFPQWNKTSCVDEYSITGLGGKGDSVYAGNEKTLYFSDDQGNTWTDLYYQMPYHGVWGPILTAGNRIFIGTDDGVCISNDNGNTFSICNNGYSGGRVTCLLLNGDVLFAGNWNGGIFKSTDFGLNWTNIMADNPFMVGSIFSIAVKGGMILAGTDGGVLISNNDGMTWVEKNSGFEDWEQYNAMALGIKDNTIFCGTQEGMFRSEDNAETWVLCQNGLTGREWFSVIKIIDGQVFAGADYGGGIHLLRSYSDTWTDITNGSSPNVLNMAFNDTDIFAGSRALPYWFTGGVFRHDLASLIGIQDIKVDNRAIHVYPNPVTTVLNIRIDKSFNSCRFSLYTPLGQCISEKAITGSSLKKDVSSLTSGVYYGLFCIDEKTMVVKILKR